MHQQMKNRGDEENCKAAASRLRKTRRAPAWPIPLSLAPEHAKQRSNASFETMHHPLEAFPELPSWLQSVAQRTQFCENKIARVVRSALFQEWRSQIKFNQSAAVRVKDL